MKAAIYHGQKDISIEEWATPHAGQNDVVIQNIYAGICGSDVAVYNHGTATGHKVGQDHEFGHEAISRVVEVGCKVKAFKVGDCVYPYPLYARGDTSRAGSMGAFSEYILIPNATLGKQLYRVPAGIETRVATLIEPMTVGTCAARHSRPTAGENALVYGAGTIGTAAAIALKYFGLKKIILVDQSDFRLGIAHNLGFETINSRVEDVQTRATAILGNATGLHGDCPDAAIFIDAVGRNEILDDFIKFGPIDSRFVAVGVNNRKPDFDFLELIYGSKSVGGSGGYRPEDVKTVLDIMVSGQFELNQMITQEVDQAHLEAGIIATTDVEHAMKVLVNFGLASSKY